jgi:hypothetical protein
MNIIIFWDVTPCSLEFFATIVKEDEYFLQSRLPSYTLKMETTDSSEKLVNIY